MPQTAALARGALLLLVAFVVVLFAALVGGAIIAGAINTETKTATIDPEAGSAVVVDQSIETVPGETRVYPTTGFAVAFAGTADSFASWRTVEAVENGPWTVCAWIHVADDATLDATMDLVAVANGSIQLEYDAGNWLVYYDNGTHDGLVRTTAQAPTDPETVCGRWTGSQLELWADGSLDGSTDLTTGPATRNVSVNLEGAVDEVRVSNQSASASLLSTYASKPTIPFDGTDRAARLMFDEGQGASSNIYFQSPDATLNNSTWTQGVPVRNLTRVGNYSWGQRPWSLTATDGGDLDDAPVAYIDYRGGGNAFGSALLQIRSLVGTAIVLFGVTLLAIPTVAVLAYLLGSEVITSIAPDLTSGLNRRK